MKKLKKTVNKLRNEVNDQKWQIKVLETLHMRKKKHWTKRGRNGPLPKPKGKKNGKKMKRWRKHINRYHKREYEHIKKKWNKIAKKAKEEEAYKSQDQDS